MKHTEEAFLAQEKSKNVYSTVDWCCYITVDSGTKKIPAHISASLKKCVNLMTLTAPW
jgi:hypothetical protein